MFLYHPDETKYPSHFPGYSIDHAPPLSTATTSPAKDYTRLLKIILVGDSNVGKSTLLQRFDTGCFKRPNFPTVALDIKLSKMKIDSEIVKVQFWDTAGQERFRCMTHSFYRDVHGIIIVFDLANRETFDNVRHWLNELSLNGIGDDIPKIIVGNKSDLIDRRQVSSAEGRKMIDRHVVGCVQYFETSALSADGVSEAFRAIPAEIVRRKSIGPQVEEKRKGSTSFMERLKHSRKQSTSGKYSKLSESQLNEISNDDFRQCRFCSVL